MSTPLRSEIITELQHMSAGSVTRLVDWFIEYAYALRASDIHIDPTQAELRVRYRVDGLLQQVFSIPLAVASEIISRIKIVAGLRTDEHQSAQDGRFRLVIGEGQPIDVRVSIAPTYFGENAVLRLLIDRTEFFTVDALGLSAANRAHIINAIKKPYGMILVTGPTGSGKTTTLYTLLKLLHTPESSLVTIEDPVEYAIDGIEQIQVNPRTGLTFAHGLRCVLRQDPNVIMVGEIRDSETAGIAINVALTGHLLLSTLHTNDPATTLPRLLDMKIEPYLVAATVNIIIGQRLVRKICGQCSMEYPMEDIVSQTWAGLIPEQYIDTDSRVWKGVGCETCNNTGYHGRIALHEVLVVNDAIHQAVLEKSSAAHITALAESYGMVPMIADGYLKCRNGLTTMEEVLRVMGGH